MTPQANQKAISLLRYGVSRPQEPPGMHERDVPIRAMYAAPAARERDETCPKGPVQLVE